jgi:hypothetical protein
METQSASRSPRARETVTRTSGTATLGSVLLSEDVTRLSISLTPGDPTNTDAAKATGQTIRSHSWCE